MFLLPNQPIVHPHHHHLFHHTNRLLNRVANLQFNQVRSPQGLRPLSQAIHRQCIQVLSPALSPQLPRVGFHRPSRRLSHHQFLVSVHLHNHPRSHHLDHQTSLQCSRLLNPPFNPQLPLVGLHRLSHRRSHHQFLVSVQLHNHPRSQHLHHQTNQQCSRLLNPAHIPRLPRVGFQRLGRRLSHHQFLALVQLDSRPLSQHLDHQISHQRSRLLNLQLPRTLR